MTYKILFVDDERGIRQYCKEELEAEGFSVVLAQDGEDALSALEQLAVDLVIMDERMPRCSGLDAARHIKKRYSDLPIILYTLDPDYEGYRSPFVDACIIKSANLDTLQSAIAEFLPVARPLQASPRALSCPVPVSC